MRLLFLLGVIVWHVTNSNGFMFEDEFLSIKKVIHGTGNYSNKLFKAVAEDISTNVILSPISALMVLSMASYGARGYTKNVMRFALELPLEDRYATLGFEYMNSQISKIKGVEFHLANAIFLNDRFTAKIPFTKVMNETFHSTLQYVDFTNGPLATRFINKWCSDQTKNKINELIQPSQLQSDTGMVLANAAYFRGYWAEQFDPTLTKSRFFFVKGTIPKNVPTMKRYGMYRSGELLDLNARYIELPYKNVDNQDAVSMYIILPNERNGIASLIQNIQRLTLEKLIFGGTTRELLLQMPKFRIETQINLAQPLTKLRMGMIFNIDADFSGITDENVRVNTMIQKAYIEVNEMGSEAAAVTALELTFYGLDTEPEPMDFIVDHPFISIITGTTVPFFYAVTVDPRI